METFEKMPNITFSMLAEKRDKPEDWAGWLKGLKA
jgi:hypothetical protein